MFDAILQVIIEIIILPVILILATPIILIMGFFGKENYYRIVKWWKKLIF